MGKLKLQESLVMPTLFKTHKKSDKSYISQPIVITQHSHIVIFISKKNAEQKKNFTNRSRKFRKKREIGGGGRNLPVVCDTTLMFLQNRYENQYNYLEHS